MPFLVDSFSFGWFSAFVLLCFIVCLFVVGFVCLFGIQVWQLDI